MKNLWSVLFFLFLDVIVLSYGSEGWAVPTLMTYQGRILQIDGTPLTYAHASFIFEVADPTGVCVIYREQVANINVQKGIFDTHIGMSHLFPADPLYSLQESLDNSISHSCQNSSTYTPSTKDTRLLKVQFHDGMAWRQITPHAVIGSVPYASFSFSSKKSQDTERLGGQLPTEYLRKSEINGNASCGPGNFLTWDATNLSLSCGTPIGGGGGTVTSISVGTGLIGGNITTAGSIGLGGPLLGFHNMVTDGYIFRSGANSYGATPGSSVVSTNNVVLRDGSGVSSFYGLDLSGSTSGNVLLKAADVSATYSLTLPDSQAAANQVLMATGTSGLLAWANMPVAPTGACNIGEVLSYNGVAFTCVPDQVGSAETGLNQLNGQSGSSQSFGAPGTGGAAPAWSSLGDVHTLNIPLAVNPGVTAGLISKAQYDVFNGKQAALGFTPLNSASNLSDLVDAGSARANLGLGTAAIVNIGTTDGTIPLIGSDGKIPLALIPTIPATVITNTPSAGVTATTAQGAINELENEKVSKTGDTMTGALTLPNSGLTVGTNELVVNGGRVGVGVTNPSFMFEVAGAVRNVAAIDNSTPTVDFATGNIQYTTQSCGAFELRNLKDGGSYTFIIQGTTVGTCTFTAYSGLGSGTLTSHMPPDHGATISGKHTVYTAIVAGTHVYFSWVPGI